MEYLIIRIEQIRLKMREKENTGMKEQDNNIDFKRVVSLRRKSE